MFEKTSSNTYFAPAITAEQLYKQDKRKRKSDDKERHLRRLDRLVTAFNAHLEEELEQERLEAEQRPLLIILKGFRSAFRKI